MEESNFYGFEKTSVSGSNVVNASQHAAQKVQQAEEKREIEIVKQAIKELAVRFEMLEDKVKALETETRKLAIK